MPISTLPKTSASLCQNELEGVLGDLLENLMLTSQSKFDNMCNLIENFYSQIFFLSSKESLFEVLIVHYELDVQHPQFAAQFDNFM